MNDAQGPWPTSGAPLISLEDVTVEFGRHVALGDISLQIARGECFSILGRNGAGKSTLVQVLTGLLRPDFGKIRFHDGARLRPMRFARRRLGFVPQSGSLDGRLSVIENLSFSAMLQGLRGPRRKAAIEAALAPFPQLADRIVGTLSTGQRRRVEVARALLHQPDVLILDEATAGIDAHSRQMIWQQVQALRDTRAITVIMTSHFMEEVAQSDRACILHGGKLLGIWPTPQLLADFGGQDYRITPAGAAQRQTLLAALPKATIDPATHDILLTTTDNDPALLALIAQNAAHISVGQAPLDRALIAATQRFAV